MYKRGFRILLNGSKTGSAFWSSLQFGMISYGGLPLVGRGAPENPPDPCNKLFLLGCLVEAWSKSMRSFFARARLNVFYFAPNTVPRGSVLGGKASFFFLTRILGHVSLPCWAKRLFRRLFQMRIRPSPRVLIYF